MKLVKATNQGIVTSLNGEIYEIKDVAIEVPDEVASELNSKFGHLIVIEDKEVIAEPVSIEETGTVIDEIIDSAPAEEAVVESTPVEEPKIEE